MAFEDDLFIIKSVKTFKNEVSGLKKILSIILSVMVFISMVPIAGVPVSAATTPADVTDATVKARFDKLRTALVGKYFTVNQTYCVAKPGEAGHPSENDCSNCYNANVIKSSWLKNCVDLVPDSISLTPRHYAPSGYITNVAWSCAGFANFVEWYLYAQKSTDDVYVEKLGNATVSYAGLKSVGAKIGNVLRSSGGHSVVLYGYDADSMSYIQCNGTRTQDGNCKVTFYDCSYATFSSSFGSTVAVTQAKNASSSSNNTSINSSTYANGIISRSFPGYEAIIYGMNYEVAEYNRKIVAVGGKANRFSLNGQDCYVPGHVCSNCEVHSICKAIGDYDVVNNTGYGYQCNGFARYIGTKVFGTTRGTTDVFNIGPADQKATYAGLRAGDIFCAKRSNGLHWMVYLSADDTGVWVLDGNGDGALGIQFRHVSYTSTYLKNARVSDAWKYTDAQRSQAVAKYAKMMGVGKAPTAPVLSVSGSSDVAVGKIATITWNAVSGAEKYVVTVQNTTTNAIIETKTITSTRYDFTPVQAGSYSVSVYATNGAGNSATAKLSSNIVAHAPCKVTFNDSDGKNLSVQSVDYGSAATAPVSPEREGYLFNGWDKVFDKVTEDITVTALYRRKTFSVSFYDYAGEKIGDTQTVYWGEAATAPEVNLRPGYTFGGWDTSFNCIKANTKVTMVDYKWYNDNMLVNLNNATAVRDSDGNGYTVTVNVQNNGEEITSGRVIVALKTANDKLLTTTESAAFSLKIDAQKDFEIFIPYEYAATQVEIYAVEKFSTAIPISSKIAIEIDQGTAWTDWSTEVPPENADYVESRTEYRYADKKVMKSGVSAMDGWTLSDTTLVSTNYGSWQTSKPTTSSRVSGNYYIDASVESKSVYHSYVWYSSSQNTFWMIKSNNTYNRYIDIYSSSPGTGTPENGYPSYKYVTASQTLKVGGYDSQLGTIYCLRDNWALVDSVTTNRNRLLPYQDSNMATIYRTVEKNYQYTLWQWGNWSDWSTTVVEGSDTRKVETRTVYRYRTNETTGIENDSGVERTINGNLGSDYAGKEAILFIYRIESASDYTNEYVGQSIICDDGSYSFTFKLREEPSINTGDFSVTLGIEGANVAINLDKIAAPLPEYTVTFMDADQKVISTQTVKEGYNAVVPDKIPEREGYYFRGWDTSTTNITNDTVVNAVYEAKTYSVVYLDWENQSVQLVEYTHGDEIDNILIPDTIDMSALGWDKVLLGETVVKENMVLTAQFVKKTFDVVFYDYDDGIISTQKVEYGNSAVVPELAEKEGYIFENWNTSNYSYVTENLNIKPVFVYEKTVADPVASLENKTYYSTQALVLTCETEGAEIYYTTDGSDPYVSGIKYSDPLTISKTSCIRFIARKDIYNPSNEVRGYYAINTDDMMTNWMPFGELPEEIVSNPAEYSLKSTAGYRYKNTVSTSSLGQKQELEDSGWVLTDTVWSDYTEWSENTPNVEDMTTEIEIKDADDIEVVVYKYSHWKYFDEESNQYISTYQEIDGEDGFWEYTTSVDSLYISSFVEGKPAYSKDGENWFNQTTASEYVSAGYQLYRYRYEINTYCKWSEWITIAPSSGETREYESDTVYQYLAPDKYIVSIDYSHSYDSEKMNDYFIVRDGYTLNLNDDFFDREGREFTALYKDQALTGTWDIVTDTVTKDITLYPMWKTNNYIVRFLDYDETIISSQIVQYLDLAKLPENPQREGYVFVGWETELSEVVSDCDYVANYVSVDEYTMVDLSRSKISMLTGTTSTIAVSITPDTSIYADLMWYSSNPDIVTIDENGNLKAVHSGTAIITVVALDTFETDSCVVTVLGTADAEILPINGSAVTVDASAKFLLGIKAGNNKIKQINEQLENIGLVYYDFWGNRYEDEDKLMGTGVKITLLDDETVVDEVELVIEGDVNGDGAVDVLDASRVARITSGFGEVSGSFKRAADISYDDKIDITDYQAIVNKVVA